MSESLYSDAALESVGTLAETIRVLTQQCRARETELALAVTKLAELTGCHRELFVHTNKAIACANRSIARLDALQNAAFAVLSDADYLRVVRAWAEMMECRDAVEAEAAARQSGGTNAPDGLG